MIRSHDVKVLSQLSDAEGREVHIIEGIFLFLVFGLVYTRERRL